MIPAGAFVETAREHGFDFYTGVPCSYLKPFINHVIDADGLDYIGAANEGDAVAIAAGAQLGGRCAVVMLQNSGLGNTVNPLTSLTHTFRIPVLLIVTLRGEPGGPADEPQHELMGRITVPLLELMEIPWSPFPDRDDGVATVIARAEASMRTERRPYALVMRKGSVAKNELQAERIERDIPATAPGRIAAQATRTEMLQAVRAGVAADDIVVATTGYTGRELFALGDRPNQFYMVGSMGCASSLGLGLAIARPDRRVVVLDGDGAALMRLGALATLGYQRPVNLLHVLLDNGIHESTGGQSTVSASIDFAAIAAACGYPRVGVAATPAELQRQLRQASRGLGFVHAPILPGVPENLPRPAITPPQVAERLRRWLVS